VYKVCLIYLYTNTRMPDLTSAPRRWMVGISRFCMSYLRTLLLRKKTTNVKRMRRCKKKPSRMSLTICCHEQYWNWDMYGDSNKPTISIRVSSLLAANSPSGDSNKPTMKSLLHFFPVQVLNCFILHTNIYFLCVLLQVGDQILAEETIVSIHVWGKQRRKMCMRKSQFSPVDSRLGIAT